MELLEADHVNETEPVAVNTTVHWTAPEVESATAADTAEHVADTDHIA